MLGATSNAGGWMVVRRDPGVEQPQAARQEHGRISSQAPSWPISETQQALSATPVLPNQKNGCTSC